METLRRFTFSIAALAGLQTCMTAPAGAQKAAADRTPAHGVDAPNGAPQIILIGDAGRDITADHQCRRLRLARPLRSPMPK